MILATVKHGVIQGVTKVECVGGCGDGVSTLGIIGLAVALLSALLAGYAVKLARQSANAADATLKIAQEQHEMLIAERRARADFKLELKVDRFPDGVIETDATLLKVTWLLEITNTGDKAASNVVVTFYAPMSVDELQWARSDDESLLSQKAGPFPRDDGFRLVDASGQSHPVQQLSKIVDRIGLRETRRFSRVSMMVKAPPTLGEELKIPASFTVFCDDMGDTPMRRMNAEATIRKR